MPTVLIVEDEPAAHKLLATLVEIRGYQTISAFDGAEAFARIEEQRPDVILLDLMLPDMNGREICKALKSSKETAGIPVVIVTASIAVENRVRCYNLGADDFVAKPYTPDEIFQALDDAALLTARGDRELAQGELDVLADDDGETLRGIARLLNLVMARTTLDPQRVARIGAFLRDLRARAGTPGADQGIARVATLRHRAFSDRIEFQWIDHVGDLFQEDSQDSHAPAFDQAEFDPEARTMTWTANLPPGT